MVNNRLAMTEIARISQNKRILALQQQDSALLTQLSLLSDDDSHLDLTTRIRFLEAVGGSPPYVLERVDESGNLDRYAFERPFLIAGRSAACDVTCQLRSLSYRHVYFQYFDGVVWWFDLDSRSGVLYQDQKRNAGCLLPGMSLQVGDYSLRLAEAQEKLPDASSKTALAKTGPTTLSVQQQPGLPQVELEFENGKIGKEKQVWPIENSITLLGRRSCCDIRFADESVSRVHASLVLTKEGLWIVDLLGRGGTKVNGVLSAYAYLHDSSLIEMGGYKIRVHYKTRFSQPHPAEAVLDEDQRAPQRRGKSSAGTVSEDLLYDLVTNMAEMQKQMFDQSQMQIGLLVQMLGSLQQSQQDLLRTEINRVHQISQEMHELQLRLAVEKSSPAEASSGKPLLSPPESLAAPDSGEAGESDADREDVLPAPSLASFGDSEPQLAAAANSPPRAKANEVQDHAVLFQRMQTLDRERNSRLQKIFRAFRVSD